MVCLLDTRPLPQSLGLLEAEMQNMFQNVQRGTCWSALLLCMVSFLQAQIWGLKHLVLREEQFLWLPRSVAQVCGEPSRCPSQRGGHCIFGDGRKSPRSGKSGRMSGWVLSLGLWDWKGTCPMSVPCPFAHLPINTYVVPAWLPPPAPSPHLSLPSSLHTLTLPKTFPLAPSFW